MKGWGWLGRRGLGITLMLCLSCSTLSTSTPEPARKIQIQQAWQFQPGDRIGEYQITAGLGDISIELGGRKIYAPFDGRVQPNVRDCVLFSSPDVPAYLFRMCGLNQPRLGSIKEGKPIGSGEYLHFATLRKLPEGTWTIVEPSRSILEKLLSPT